MLPNLTPQPNPQPCGRVSLEMSVSCDASLLPRIQQDITTAVHDITAALQQTTQQQQQQQQTVQQQIDMASAAAAAAAAAAAGLKRPCDGAADAFAPAAAAKRVCA